DLRRAGRRPCALAAIAPDVARARLDARPGRPAPSPARGLGVALLALCLRGGLPRESGTSMTDLTARELASELDRFIIGQKEAKRAVAVALRNRWRRQQLDPALQAEIYPKNSLMIGPTGVGKTEISRRLAKLAHAPFIKVEATKFTQVGYVGRDVEQIVR